MASLHPTWFLNWYPLGATVFAKSLLNPAYSDCNKKVSVILRRFMSRFLPFWPASWLPFDRWAITLMLIFSFLIGGLLLWGDRSFAKVRDFNWQDQQIGARDQAMVFTFSRPMDQASVEEHFQVQPALEGKFSWAGRRMAYTLTYPAPYGTAYQVKIQTARDRFAAGGDQPMQPFVAEFRSRDRAFIYLGVEGDEENALVLYNLTHQEKRILTPKELVVVDFEPYPQGDRILFSATDRTTFDQGQFQPKLYTVTTGIPDLTLPDPTAPRDPSSGNLPNPFTHTQAESTPSAGVVQQILESGGYQNLKFDLAPNGQFIIVQRANLKNPGADFGLWMVREGQAPEPLKTKPGGEFLITPDSNGLIMAQGQGLAVLPLESNQKPLDFLPQFGQVLNLSADGTKAAMIRFNTDYTRSLFLVTNQGQQRELWRTDGSILKAEFDPTQQVLYALVSRLADQEAYVEEPFLIAIDLKKALDLDSFQSSDASASPEKAENPDQGFNPEAVRPLLRLANQRDVAMSLAPDGLALLFDQVEDETTDNNNGKTIRKSRLWLLPLIPPHLTGGDLPLPQPELLPLPGLQPRWLP